MKKRKNEKTIKYCINSNNFAKPSVRTAWLCFVYAGGIDGGYKILGK